MSRGHDEHETDYSWMRGKEAPSSNAATESLRLIHHSPGHLHFQLRAEQFRPCSHRGRHVSLRVDPDGFHPPPPSTWVNRLQHLRRFIHFRPFATAGGVTLGPIGSIQNHPPRPVTGSVRADQNDAHLRCQNDAL
eukprot:2539654-Pyramimonas_sp.AAC.1